MTYGNNGYGPSNMEAIVAHETGHIFYALDQYYSAYQPCTRRSGYLDVDNQNSQYGECLSNTISIMRGQTFPYAIDAIDPYAAGQIGWRDSDGDGIFDPLNADLPISISSISGDGQNKTVEGAAEIIPYPSPSQTNVTINTLTGIQYRVDNGDWQQATASDGVFDETAENYSFTVTSLTPGFRTLEVAALDSAGNTSDSYATETIAVLDPIDGGLNTELPPAGVSFINQTVIVTGVAYHMEGERIANVKYRVDGGPWQVVEAQDGAFDSDYEHFAIMFNSPEPEPHLIEAFSQDATGYSELNIARLEVTSTQPTPLFLPIVAQGPTN